MGELLESTGFTPNIENIRRFRLMPSPKSNKVSSKVPARPKEPSTEDDPAELPEEETEAGRLREEIRQLQNGLARARADLANLQKRHERERAAAVRYQVEPLARELLDVLDAMEEAQDVMARDEGVPEAVREGQALTLRHMARILNRFSIELIDPKGEAFDPQLHEAMATQPAEEHAPGSVIEVFRKGYRMHDRLLRPARVVVAADPAPEKPGAGDEDDDPAPPENLQI